MCIAPVGMPRNTRRRGMLSKEQAIEIFMIRMEGGWDSAASVSRRFGVNEKTVRDIWSGRSWGKETSVYLRKAEDRLPGALSDDACEYCQDRNCCFQAEGPHETCQHRDCEFQWITGEEPQPAIDDVLFAWEQNDFLHSLPLSQLFGVSTTASSAPIGFEYGDFHLQSTTQIVECNLESFH
mmetsp:Transcript_58612/g.154980  ORF Transcript_58612/g.154980 Transcript_58612/m.154980 type:complete len:181 (+) Transcript_58612:112-654(+)